MSRLWYEQPAAEWEEALPIGNGRLGAMVYGGTDTERLQLNEESMWYGGKVNRINPDFKRKLPEIRRLLDQGQIGAAERLMDKAMSGCPDSMHPYQTLGEIGFTFYGIEKDAVTGYRRTLDLERAVVVTEFSCNGTTYRREAFASKPGDCIILRFTAEGPGMLDFTSRMRRGKFFDGVGKCGEDCVELYGNLGRGGWEFSMALRAFARGGKVSVLGESLDAEGAKEVLLYFTADTTYHCGRAEQDAWVDARRALYVGEAAPGSGNDGETAAAGRVPGSHSGITPWAGTGGGETAAAGRVPGSHSGITPGAGTGGGRACAGGVSGNRSEVGGTEGTDERLCPAERHFLSLACNPDLPKHERQELLTRAALQALLHQRNAGRIARCMERGFEALLEEHVADHRGLYGRFAFELEGTEGLDALPTDRRLRQAKEGKADVGLSKLLFDFGRYLTIACSREGGLPSTLQGLWNKDFTPPWDSKYTININTEMNYWHVEGCNLSECHLPLFTLLEKVRETGRKTAREMYGCRGFVAHHNTDVHGDSAPQDIWYPGSYWTMGGAWLATHLWTHYQYTRDRTFLERAFPILAESALFFVDFLIERDGFLVTSPSVSPENTYRLPNGQSGSCCIGATMDNQIMRHLFTDCLEAWEALGKRAPEGCEIPGVESVAELVEEIADCRGRLIPTRVSDSGRILEWQEDYEEMEPGHRHVSHLYGLYPGGEITVDKTPELAAAARRTLEYRLSHGGGHTGWSRAWIMNHYASLWDGEAAYDNIEKMLAQSTYPNLFDRHPPFQIDGNFGACAAMCGMLAQSDGERVVLLPALPNAWKTGSVRGLRLVGNAELEMYWREGRLVRASVTAYSDYDTTVICGGASTVLKLKAGEKRELTF